MKKWRIVLAAVLASIAAVACGTAIGCKKHTDDNPWSSDRYTHWHTSAGEKVDEEGHTWNDNNSCTVCGMKRANGIEVKKDVTVYKMGAKSAINVPVNDLTVNLLKEDGSVDRAMSANEYTIKYYKGKTELTDLSAVDAGSYNIWVEAKINNQIVDSCVVVYVTDIFADLVKTEGETTQVIGGDHISPTWKFRASFLSGNTIDLDISDVRVSSFTTFEIADDHEATVTYSYVNSLGESTSKSVFVPYVITAPEGDVIFNERSFSYDDIKGMSKDSTVLKQEDMTGANSFLTVTDVADFKWRSASGKYVEIQGPSLQVEFQGTGVFKINCASTGGTNVSGLALMDEDGNYVTASYSSNKVEAGEEIATYAIYGNAGVDFSFTINKPGKYTICSVDEVQTAEDIIGTKRYLRIWNISMIDIAVAVSE